MSSITTPTAPEYEIDTLVIGAGVIGLAVARALAPKVADLLVLEAEELPGSGISSRNSEVIHAGIYYPPGSNKARWCVAGRQQLYAYCESNQLPHRRCGKIIVATQDSQIDALTRLLANGQANGVADLHWLDAPDLRALEPDLQGVAGLYSPATGILDSHQLMLQLQADAEGAGAQVVCNSRVVAARVQSAGFSVRVAGAQPCTLHCRRLINAAGLHAVSLLKQFEGFASGHIPAFYLARGNYFSFMGKAPFRHLVYPVPEAGGLGVHLTLDMAGQARFGPDVQWLDAIDYRVSEARLSHFYEEIRRYWPRLPAGSLQPAYAGIRPKLSGPGEPATDFVVQDESVHGIAGLVNLLGMESPGLTACLAIAEAVVDALRLR